jgi:hypothetical protein
VAAEERRTATRLALQLGGGADHHRRHRWGLVVGRGADHVGDDAGHVVGAAGLEARPDQLDGGEVGRPGREDVGEPAFVERARGAVAAQQDPVGLGQLDDEEVGVDVVHPVEGLEDQVLVRVGARVLLGDPTLVDQALHERVVAGELADLAVPVEVGAAVTDVTHRQPPAVEEGHRGGGAGPAESRLLVDEVADLVRGAVERAGDQLQPVLGVVVLTGRLVEAAELTDRGARG